MITNPCVIARTSVLILLAENRNEAQVDHMAQADKVGSKERSDRAGIGVQVLTIPFLILLECIQTYNLIAVI